MSDSLAELFKDDDYCAKEICRIREAIGTRLATQKTFDAAHSALGFMLLNCSENMRSLVMGQLMETTKRQGYAFIAGLI
jgi:hypothetical protein